LNHLRGDLTIKGIRRVVMHERLTNLRPVIFLQYAAETPKSEVWRRLSGASTFMAGCGNIVFGGGEDVDPDAAQSVLWAPAYRSNPIEDVHIAPYRSNLQGAQYGPRSADSSMLIDATRKRPMPPLALPARPFMEHARTIWEELGLPALTAQSPWHGYTLGDWTETWEAYARRAAKGDWETTGRETLARQRTGVMPETPTREGAA